MQLNTRILSKIVGLLVLSVLFGLLYFFWIKPGAEAAPAARLAGKIGDGYTLMEILNGPEQMFCFILFFWIVFFVLLEQFLEAGREKKLIAQDLMPLEEDVGIRPQDAMGYMRKLEHGQLPESQYNMLLPRVLRRALSRFHAGHSIEDVSRSVTAVCEDELSRLEASSSAVRYVAWAIPSIGFVGTVRGIGEGLGRAADAIANSNITPVTQALGLAFNSTLIALLLSIILMLLIHWLQASQEESVQGVMDYAEDHCIDRMEPTEAVA